MTAKKFQKEEIMTLEEAIEKDGQRHIYVTFFCIVVFFRKFIEIMILLINRSYITRP